MSVIKCLASMSLAAIILPALYAEAHCPGNIASVPLRFINRHQIVLAVSINHAGPYNFLLDSGTQITMLDPSLAAALHLDTQGAAVVAGAGSRQSASFAQLDLVEAGSHAVANQKVLVYDLRNLHSADLPIQGILGEDFLEHFDMLIDNAHRLLCLDNSAALRAEVKGPHIPLVTTAEPYDGVALPGLLIIAVRLSDGMRPARLLLDSGAQAPILYNTSQYMELQLSHDVPLRGSGVDGKQRIFSALPPQDVKIDSLQLARVAFFSLAGAQKDPRVKGFDGVLPLGGNANTVSAQTSALQVQVYDYAGLSPAALHEFIARTQEILASSGVSLEVDACARGAAPCESHTGSSRQVVIRVVADTGKNMKNVRVEKLGMSVAGHDGGTYGTVFLKPAQEKASDTNLPRSIVLAYAAAHEVGHLLLGDAHCPQGLMKAIWNMNDFQAMAQSNLHFSPQQARELASRYGTAHQADAGADTAVAVRR